MIIAENSEYYRMISQNDHGDLAGQFAAHWGNEQFARLEPYQSMVLAAETHDNGWWDWDIYPSIHRRAGRADTVYPHAARIPFDLLREGHRQRRGPGPL